MRADGLNPAPRTQISPLEVALLVVDGTLNLVLDTPDPGSMIVLGKYFSRRHLKAIVAVRTAAEDIMAARFA